MDPADHETFYAAIQTRDPAFATAFVYGVRTTKVYCRPSCKARLARRVNVSFYATPAEARQAGFRACKRCRPDEVAWEGDDAEKKVRERVRSLEDAIGRGDAGAKGVTVEKMAKEVGVSKWHFHRVFRKVIGTTPGEWVKALEGRAQQVPPVDAADGVHGLNAGDGQNFAIGDESSALDMTSDVWSSSESPAFWEVPSEPMDGTSVTNTPFERPPVRYAKMELHFGKVIVAFLDSKINVDGKGESDEKLQRRAQQIASLLEAEVEAG